MCYALVIHDVFYKHNTVSAEKISHDSCETDDSEYDETVDEMEDLDGLTILGTEQENALMLNLDISHIVKKFVEFQNYSSVLHLQTKFCGIMLKKNIQMVCS